ncbi:MAG: SMI1/KNR4 family protein [Candidatus Nucleicultricaceae bacterium]
MLQENIQWLDAGKIINRETISDWENKAGIKLPQIYVQLIQNHDGGTPIKEDFKYFDNAFQKTRVSGIGAFISFQPEDKFNMLHYFQDPPEFFPKGLIAFASTGGGDFICFDYRDGKSNSDPDIVLWDHEADIGKDVSFVAKNFEEFMSILEEPEDLEI